MWSPQHLLALLASILIHERLEPGDGDDGWVLAPLVEITLVLALDKFIATDPQVVSGTSVEEIASLSV